MHTRAEPGIDLKAVEALVAAETLISEESGTFAEEELERAFEQLTLASAEDWTAERSAEEVSFIGKANQMSKVGEAYALSEIDVVLGGRGPEAYTESLQIDETAARAASSWDITALMTSSGM